MALNEIKREESGWHNGIFPCLQPLGPQFKSHQGHYVDWVFSPYLTALVFPGIFLWGFPPTSKTATSFIVFSPFGFLTSTCRWIKFAFLTAVGFTRNEMKLNQTNCEKMDVLCSPPRLLLLKSLKFLPFHQTWVLAFVLLGLKLITTNK